MTTVVILILGFGAILIISALETDQTTGKSVSVLQTISDVWNNKVNVSAMGAPASTSSGPTAAGGAGNTNGPSRGQPNPGAGGTAHYAAMRSTAANYWIRQGKGYGLGA